MIFASLHTIYTLLRYAIAHYAEGYFYAKADFSSPWLRFQMLHYSSAPPDAILRRRQYFSRAASLRHTPITYAIRRRFQSENVRHCQMPIFTLITMPPSFFFFFFAQLSAITLMPILPPSF